MSSVVRPTIPLLLLAAAGLATPALAQDGSEWDQARARLAASQRGTMAQAIGRWQVLSTSPRFTFGDYSAFLLTYPGFPDEAKMRTAAEAVLNQPANLGQAMETVGAAVAGERQYNNYYVAAKYVVNVGEDPVVESWGAFTATNCRRVETAQASSS